MRWPPRTPSFRMARAKYGGSDGNLIRFTVTADSHGSLGVNQFVFKISTSTTVSASSLNLYAYSDSSYSTPASGTSGGVAGSTSAVNQTFATSTMSTPIQVSAGQTIYFQLRAGTVTPGDVTYNINTTLLGDATFAGMSQAATLTSGGSHMIWSPNATGTAVTTDNDWTNGTGLSGLPSVGISQNRTQ